VTNHRVGVRAWNGKDEPPHDAARKTFRVRLDQIPHDSTIEPGDHDAQYRPLDEEERVQEKHQGLPASPPGQDDHHDGAQLPEEVAVDADLGAGGDGREGRDVLGERRRWDGPDLDLQRAMRIRLISLARAS
jgi:hypothetical protein